MALTSRSPEFETDLHVIARLVESSSSRSRHRFDSPWRLSNPAIWSGGDARLWFDNDGHAVAFAAWQQPWAVLDFSVPAGPRSPEAEEAIFAWASDRFREIDRLRGRRLPYWVEARDDDDEWLSLLARHGYTLDDDYAYITLSRDLRDPIPQAATPHGFSIRAFHGMTEVDAYAALHRRAFGSETMTAEWRRRTLHMPRYRPELDLVAAAPGGTLVGFCIGWLDEAERVAQVEPLGIDPDFRGLGLGQTLLREMLQRFQQYGAEIALVETETTRTTARGVYDAIGFRSDHLSRRKGQWFS